VTGSRYAGPLVCRSRATRPVPQTARLGLKKNLLDGDSTLTPAVSPCYFMTDPRPKKRRDRERTLKSAVAINVVIHGQGRGDDVGTPGVGISHPDLAVQGHQVLRDLVCIDYPGALHSCAQVRQSLRFPGQPRFMGRNESPEAILVGASEQSRVQFQGASPFESFQHNFRVRGPV
jgi:hypothetical protein